MIKQIINLVIRVESKVNKFIKIYFFNSLFIYLFIY